MYNLWIPIFNRKFTQEELNKKIRELKRCNPQLILITFNRFLFDKEKLATEKALFSHNKSVFEAAGFKVGAWLFPTIGYGAKQNFNEDAPFTHLKKFNGENIGDAYCPLDDDFTDAYCNLMQEIASTGVETIMFEDDFTFTGGKVFPATNSSCCCEKHIKLYEEKLGETVDTACLSDLIYKSGPNKYRDVWFDMQGEILKNFCAKIEKETHGIYPDVRIGLSANASSYVGEGVGIDVLAKIIAGKNKPFIRLTGAPYWQNLSTYATNIEAIRLQCEWCKGDIDLMTEGDTFPRPRHWVSANKLEIYDMALRADNTSHSILKYMIDYNSSADYETGYVDRHVKNENAYNYIASNFTGESVGLRIFETYETIKNITFDENFPVDTYGRPFLPTVSQQFTTDNSIPVTYSNKDSATLCFGENAKYLSEDALNKGVILDASAAKILYEKGIDIGINGFNRTASPNAEVFAESDEVVTCTTSGGSVFYCFDLKENAIKDSTFICTPAGLGVVPSVVDAKNYINYPACFKYENANGQRFMIYSFTAQTVLVDNKGWNTGVFRSYTRQQQLIDGIKWLQKGKGLPAVLTKAPELYILCNQTENGLSVGLWNIFPDEILNPEIILNDNYSHLDCFNCEGEIIGNKVKLNAPIAPYSHAFFTLKK